MLSKSHFSAFPSDHERVALGNEEGLFVIHVTKDGESHYLTKWNVDEFPVSFSVTLLTRASFLQKSFGWATIRKCTTST